MRPGIIASGATFSPCGAYRYSLWRILAPRWSRMVLFLMCNPSTADEVDNDPTVERCERRAQAMGFDGYYVANLFAYRSTDPRGLLQVDDPVGPDNDLAILTLAAQSEMIVCAWGGPGRLLRRGATVLANLRRDGQGEKLHALKLNADGSPGHPLYVPYARQPELMK